MITSDSSKITIILMGVLSTYSFSLATFSPLNMMDKKWCSAFGTEEASPECQQHIYEYLGDLGIKNPNNVPIRQMSLDAIKTYNCPYVVRSTGIWLNETVLSNKQALKSPNRVYLLTRAAVQYAMSCKLALLLSLKNTTDWIPSIAPAVDFASSLFLFSQVYKKTSSPDCITKLNIVADAAILTALHYLPTALQYMLNKLLSLCSKSIERLVEKETAEILCKKGQTEIVKAMILNLEYTANQGVKTNSHLQPSIREIINSLQEIVSKWQPVGEESTDQQQENPNLDPQQEG